jgi:hypothetical protein
MSVNICLNESLQKTSHAKGYIETSNQSRMERTSGWEGDEKNYCPGRVSAFVCPAPARWLRQMTPKRTLLS